MDNQAQYQYLVQAWNKSKLSHAYIIEGRAAVCLDFVDRISKALLCDNNRSLPSKGLPCNSCPSCIKADSGNHPDLITIRHSKETVISVGEIREQLVNDISIKPYYGPYKIYIVPDAQLMNENAQNALLKTIEEPQEYGLIFLLTDNADTFLQTIRSRCIRIPMDPVSGIQSAAELMDEDGAGIIEFISEIGRADALRINRQAKAMESMNQQRIMELLMLWYRDILVEKSTRDDSRIFFREQLQQVRTAAQKVSYEGLNRIFQSIEETKARLKASVKAEAAYENLLLDLRRELV